MNSRHLQVALMMASFFLAYVLSVMPLSMEWRWFRPNFVALVMVFWLLKSPFHIGLAGAWFLGLMLDAVEGGYLGQHALSFTIIAYVVMVLYQRIRVFAAGQQAFLVFVLLGLDQIIMSWVYMVFRAGEFIDASILSSALTGALLWPLLVWVMYRFQSFFALR
jgi:rod shape-determining protein MreD